MQERWHICCSRGLRQQHAWKRWQHGSTASRQCCWHREHSVPARRIPTYRGRAIIGRLRVLKPSGARHRSVTTCRALGDHASSMRGECNLTRGQCNLMHMLRLSSCSISSQVPCMPTCLSILAELSSHREIGSAIGSGELDRMSALQHPSTAVCRSR